MNKEEPKSVCVGDKDTKRTDGHDEKKAKVQGKKRTRQEIIEERKRAKLEKIKAKAMPLEPPNLTFTEMNTVEGRYVFAGDEKTIRDSLRNVNAWKNLAVDCEGDNLGRAGTLSLIQVATPDHKAYLFDVHTPELCKMVMDGGLRKVLESRKVVKYMHDCRRDSDALWHHAQTKLHNVLDTQIAHVVLTKMEKKPAPLPVGLGAVLKLYLGFEYKNKDEMHRRMASESGFWDKRPLSEDVLEYACTDVLLLHKLIAKLEEFMLMANREEWVRYSEAYTTIVRYADDPNEVVMHEGIPLYGISDYDKDVIEYVKELEKKGKWKKNKRS